ncbi:ImmA/IrrE family metallo-endopeptidase [Paenibacillus sp. HN-1]|uniref:ImmA/IrrE family metallo-endopeptidase n=1 Tax=Paenibacillus TaxID=44249 RepID=UPI001CA951F9|nr:MULTISPECIES: ImmA/IrrE family metallo-endopeptidase [Paenibacillus]MBY9077157.1 ImmA/IrrE family metallo-endopeptidase [Paenibacillus sp. CGMCC 1.18879]MBY9084447.1 ImmA/IrrE family metallo-endopeptidase [Paenibacillus sinensis]
MGNNIVDLLIKAHGTNDPTRIADEHSIRVLYEDLGKNTWGYYSCIKRIPIIHVNSSLPDFFRPFTVAHELGHHFLHRGVNTPFLRGNTLLSVDKIEREANRFAMALLVGLLQPYQDETKSQFLLRCGIPIQLHTFL